MLIQRPFHGLTFDLQSKILENIERRIKHEMPCSSANLADEIQSVLSRLSNENENCVRSVYTQLRHAPAIILYTQDQIDDIRMLCSKECMPSLHSVLSVDRTFNLSSLFVT